MSKRKQDDIPKKPSNHLDIYASVEWAKLTKDEKKDVNYFKWKSSTAKLAWNALDDESKKPYIDVYNQRLTAYNDYVEEHGSMCLLDFLVLYLCF